MGFRGGVNVLLAFYCAVALVEFGVFVVGTCGLSEGDGEPVCAVFPAAFEKVAADEAPYAVQQGGKGAAGFVPCVLFGVEAAVLLHFADKGFYAVVGVVVEVARKQLGAVALGDDEGFVDGAAVVLGVVAVVETGDDVGRPAAACDGTALVVVDAVEGVDVFRLR